MQLGQRLGRALLELDAVLFAESPVHGLTVHSDSFLPCHRYDVVKQLDLFGYHFVSVCRFGPFLNFSCRSFTLSSQASNNLAMSCLGGLSSFSFSHSIESMRTAMQAYVFAR